MHVKCSFARLSGCRDWSFLPIVRAQVPLSIPRVYLHVSFGKMPEGICLQRFLFLTKVDHIWRQHHPCSSQQRKYFHSVCWETCPWLRSTGCLTQTVISKHIIILLSYHNQGKMVGQYLWSELYIGICLAERTPCHPSAGLSCSGNVCFLNKPYFY